jgi:GNAT superfamily N-acetyltransferase
MHRIRLAVRENILTSRVDESDYAEMIDRLGCGWVTEADGVMTGFAFGTRDGNIWALFVDPEHEGRGYGRILHGVMVTWLFAQGCERLWLTTGTDTRAERFYRAAGWEYVGPEDGEARYEMGRG